MLFPHGLCYVKKLISSTFSSNFLWQCRRICQFSFDFSNFNTLFHTLQKFLNSVKMANLKAEFVAVILVLDVRTFGQLKTAFLRQQKLATIFTEN